MLKSRVTNVKKQTSNRGNVIDLQNFPENLSFLQWSKTMSLTG